MKKLSIISLFAGLGARVISGVWKIKTPTDDDVNPLVVLNDTANEDTESKFGYNFIFTDDNGDLNVSMKENPLYDATAVNSTAKQYIPANFATAKEAADAYDNNKSTFAQVV